MDFIGRNIKKAKILCSVLLFGALVMCVIKFFYPCTIPVRYVQDAVYILAVIAGFGYTFGSFKKSVSEKYMLFMYMACLEFILLLAYELIAAVNEGYRNPFSEMLDTVNCVNLLLLTFAKDLGRKTSIGLGCAILVVTLIQSIGTLILYSDVYVLVADAVMTLALGCVICLFILEKYADKAARGTK